jgi:hypothetical protein
MTSKPVSWAMTVPIFFMMAVVEFALTMAFNATMRSQAGLIHSEFWQFVLPPFLVADAAFVIGARFIVNWAWTRRRCVVSETHQSSLS